ncbi:N-acetylmuramoyl-L-alanine amidase [uncultured Sphingomonas sp.]|uniref:peptidoglycan recognition protein family protein n=1 Tax=uncultured Sphingomonas sp. TaxID=158754 RepID=UPI0026183EC9|nr:N-acetylmuramoyl-L-alanine amidase [uncultured Sphingomonas sp.]
MAKCPFAQWHPITGPSGRHLGGPYKIVHHTTEGSSAAGAFAAFAKHRSDPHFTVDGTTVYQHIDTDVAARALRHDAGTPETNRDSAVQIEVVGFAGAPKRTATLKNVARLCRWIEAAHGIPQLWPAGLPKPAIRGRDPGGHRRDAALWGDQGGHFGHSQVPGNTHWDPAYSAAEANYVLYATFDPDGAPTNRDDPRVAPLLARAAVPATDYAPEVMDDHDADAGEPDAGEPR